eukprot:TRINITY_DN4945_c0_g1_i2.p2 TRINITY_DN4945_c0_g1~~TRINITY_DN4945_c0_g1_i2.p2  ORF type:complete len:124 (+),score=41.96 TRINITY_DN4945_c0_g1_i2:342-713(+)
MLEQHEDQQLYKRVLDVCTDVDYENHYTWTRLAKFCYQIDRSPEDGFNAFEESVTVANTAKVALDNAKWLNHNTDDVEAIQRMYEMAIEIEPNRKNRKALERFERMQEKKREKEGEEEEEREE